MGNIKWNSGGEAYTEKNAKSYKEFQYESSNSVELLADLIKINNEVTEAANDVNKELNKISKTFDSFTNFESLLETSVNNIDKSISSVTSSINSVGKLMSLTIESFAKNDETLLDDLKRINSVLGNSKDSSSSSKGGNSSGNKGNGGSKGSDPKPSANNPSVGNSSVNSSDNVSTAQALGITPEQLDIVKATIRHEAGSNINEIANVASCIKNRMNSGRWGGGNNAYGVTTASGQFSSYLNGYYKQYTDGNYGGSDVDALINSILLGTTPTTHNYESFRSSGSGYGTQLVSGGNEYK